MKRGVWFAIGSSLVFSIMNALVKEISDTVPSSEIVFFRSIIGTVLILAIMWGRKISFSRGGTSLLALRGVTGALYLLCYFYAIAHMPLGDASILAHLSPMFSIVLSVLVLKEHLSRRTKLLLPLAVIGALLVVRPFSYASYSLSGLIGVLSALFAAMASIAIRRLSRDHHAYEIVFYFLATATLISAPLMAAHFVVPDARAWLFLGAIGVVSLLGQLFLTQAFSSENVAVVAVTRYIGIVFNMGWGWLCWSEVPTGFTLAGGALIVAACIGFSWKDKRA